MISRFQIEDIEVQDSSGIVFRATDTATGLPVSIRRFFPFGSASGGLNADDQADYGILLGQLANIGHPALRPIICGGCDPVDGMPYVAADWIQGDSLDTLLDHRPLSQPEAIALIHLALDACAALSKELGSEGVWIETAANTIVIRPVGAQRPFNFWISPLRWLSRTIDPRGLEPLIGLTQSIMGVVDKPAGILPAGGMGDWLKWLHGAAATASLREAREMLNSITGAAPSPVTAQPTRQRTVHLPPAKTGSKWPLWLLSFTVLIALGLGGWILVQRNAKLLAEASKPLVRVAGTAAVPRAVAPPANAVDPMPAVANTASNADLEKRIAARNGILLASDHDLLLASVGRSFTVAGVCEKIGSSKNKNTIFLLFTQAGINSEFHIYIPKAIAEGLLSEAELTKLKGQKIQVTGVVRVEKGTNPDRPYISIESRESIQVVE